MASERDRLIERMHEIIKQSVQLTDRHAKLVEEFQRISKEIEELTQKEGEELPQPE